MTTQVMYFSAGVFVGIISGLFWMYMLINLEK